MKVSYLVIWLSFFVLTGCVPQKTMYNWDIYSSSLYRLKKDPSDVNLQSHKEVLLKIMEVSKSDGLRVPPGVYCEYGYMMLSEGKVNESLAYFDLEQQTYPESAVFIQKLKSRAAKVKE